LSDLLVQPMPHAGIFERYQQLAAAMSAAAASRLPDRGHPAG
jgi:hypothetical protein